MNAHEIHAHYNRHNKVSPSPKLSSPNTSKSVANNINILLCLKNRRPTLGVRFREVSDDVHSLYKRIDFRLLFITLLYLACVQTPLPQKKNR